MMTSFAENIPIILTIVSALRPKKILDIGSGFGKFGLLIREALLSTRAEEKTEIIPIKDFSIDCIENCDYFISQPYHTLIYDQHFHKDFFEIDMRFFADYDLILLIDVVEHHEKAKMIKWIQDVRVASKKAKILVSTPKKVVYYTEHYYGSDCPLHISQWSLADFKIFPTWTAEAKNSYIVVIK